MTTEPRSRTSVRTLLVDGFRPFRQFLSSLLQQRAQVEIIGEAGAGLEAVQMAQELQPDLILLDISIPQLNGIEAAKRIRVLSPQSKILFITLSSDVRVIQTAFDAGAAGYVVKTDAPREVLPAIDATLRGERFVSARFAEAFSPEATAALDSNSVEDSDLKSTTF